MITRNEKAKGLWWRLLATLPVLAFLMIANTKVSAQEMKADEVAGTSATVVRSVTDGDNTTTNPVNDTVFQIVDEMPKFPGGEQAMMDFIAKNVKYPQEARDKEISGRVYVSFVVEKDGNIGNVQVIRGIGGGCNDEAIRVVKAMPKWTPGKQKGEPVRVNYILPFIFKLDGGKSNGNSLVGTIWEGIGTGTKGDVTYTWHSTMQFSSENEGFLIEKFVSQKKGADPVVEFEDVAMDFEYAFDGKKTGAITPKNGDGTYMDEQPPEGFVLSDDGKTLILNFYTATEETGIKNVTYTRK